MKAGELNCRVQLQRPDTNTVGAGQPSRAFIDVAKVWADMRNLSGLAAIKADAKGSKVRTSARIRFREDVQSGWRLVHGATAYKVEAVLPDLKRREHVDLVCEVV